PELGLRGVGMVAGGHFGASCPRSGSLCRWLITTGAADQMARRGQQDPTDWVSRAADDALRHADDTGRGADGLITVASGLSPSGPIHLGNLREFLTVHFVAEELRSRGLNVRHLHSRDDYDRLRRVPAGVDEAWHEHIGRPLSSVPDPWECHHSWAEHFKAPLRDAL